MSKVVSLFEQYVKLAQNLQSEVKNAAVAVDDPEKLSDTIASHLVMSVDEKQNLLEIWNPMERLTRISSALEWRSTSSRWTDGSRAGCASRWSGRRRSTTSTRR